MKKKKNLSLLLLLFAGALVSFQHPVPVEKMDNQTFVTKAAASNTFEIEVGKLAAKNAKHQSVKDYGEKMVADHTQVGKEMKTLAESKNLEVPTKLPPAKESDLEKLRTATDENFDKVFKELMVKSHEEAVKLFSTASGADGVTDKELKAFAAEKLPALQMHLKMAKELKTEKNN